MVLFLPVSKESTFYHEVAAQGDDSVPGKKFLTTGENLSNSSVLAGGQPAEGGWPGPTVLDQILRYSTTPDRTFSCCTITLLA